MEPTRNNLPVKVRREMVALLNVRLSQSLAAFGEQVRAAIERADELGDAGTADLLTGIPRRRLELHCPPRGQRTWRNRVATPAIVEAVFGGTPRIDYDSLR